MVIYFYFLFFWENVNCQLSGLSFCCGDPQLDPCRGSLEGHSWASSHWTTAGDRSPCSALENYCELCYSNLDLQKEENWLTCCHSSLAAEQNNDCRSQLQCKTLEQEFIHRASREEAVSAVTPESSALCKPPYIFQDVSRTVWALVGRVGATFEEPNRSCQRSDWPGYVQYRWAYRKLQMHLLPNAAFWLVSLSFGLLFTLKINK